MDADTALAGKPVVLCIDDEPPILAALERLLRREPYEVITTRDPEEALRVIERCSVSLLIADQRMPRIHGTDLLKQVRRKSPRTARVILTAFPDTEVIRERIHQGIQRLITKPWREEDLKRTIRELLPHASPFPVRSEISGARTWKSPDLLEPIVRIDCRRRSAVDAFADLVGAVDAPASSGRGLVVLLENLALLQGSVPTFLGEIASWIEAWEIRTTLVDGSGCAGATLGSCERPLLLSVFGPVSHPRRVLVVGNQDDCNEALSALLEATRQPCDVAVSATEALSCLSHTAYEIVVLDLALPDSEAITVARHVHSPGSSTEVVALCTCPDLWDESMCEPLGIRHRIKKPYRAGALLEILREDACLPRS